MGKCASCGKGGVFQRVNEEGLCVSCVTQRYRRLLETAPKESKDLPRIKAELDEKKKALETAKRELEAANRELSSVRKELIVAQEDQELEEFAL